MLRAFDILLSAVGIVAMCPLLIILSIVGWLDTGSPLFRQIRVGRSGKPFTLYKFRTMHVDTEDIATHLVDPLKVTPCGRLLRRTRADELPQLWNVLKGEMSLVGPRPCLFCQNDLIAARRRLGVLEVRPGVTGLAQVTGIDMSTPELLAETDARMLRSLTPGYYFYYIARTIVGKS